MNVCSNTHMQHNKYTLPNHYLVFSKTESTLKKARDGITLKKKKKTKIDAYRKANLKEPKDSRCLIPEN